MVLVFCTSSLDDLHFCETSRKYLKRFFNLHSGHEYMVEMALFNVQRTITPKVSNQSYDSCSLHVVLHLCEVS